MHKVLKGALQGIAFLHQNGVIHCDIKPENIMVSAEDVAIVADFETSTVRAPHLTQTMRATVAMATPSYASPELQAAPGDFTRQSDMFAFGVLMGVVLSGKAPSEVATNGALQIDEIALAVVRRLLNVNPQLRIPASKLLHAEYFRVAPSHRVRECALSVSCIGSAKTVRDGWECTDGHFSCAECIGEIVNHQVTDLAKTEKQRGHVWCAGRIVRIEDGRAVDVVCENPMADTDVATHLTEANFRKYVDGRFSLMDRLLRRQLNVENERLLQQRVEELVAMDAKRRQIELAKLHITATVLVDHCPACNAAFFDFTGCFAVSCNSCPAGFCAWCLEHCGTDAHQHVLHCRLNLNPNTYYGTNVQFEQVRRTRWRQRVLAHLNTLVADIRADVVAAAARDLNDIGLQDVVQQFGAAAPAAANSAAAAAAVRARGANGDEQAWDQEIALAIATAPEDGAFDAFAN